MKRDSNILIIGGSSGLGFEIANLLSGQDTIFITGRRNPEKNNLKFIQLDLAGEESFSTKLDLFVDRLPIINLLIYAAGFYQEGSISDLNDSAIFDMNAVGLLAPALLVQKLLKKQDALAGFIAITSTSQWTPRPLEPVYAAVKAGLGMFAHSISFDPKMGKVLVAGPSGMKTQFWTKTKKDTSGMLEPKWVAEQILNLFSDDFKYKFVRILRGPARIEVVDQR